MNCGERWKQKGGDCRGSLLFPRRLCSSTCSPQCHHDNGRAHLRHSRISGLSLFFAPLILSFTLFSFSACSFSFCLSLSLFRSPSLIKMRLQQSGGGGEITPYLRERQEERHVNYILQLDMWTFMAL